MNCRYRCFSNGDIVEVYEHSKYFKHSFDSKELAEYHYYLELIALLERNNNSIDESIHELKLQRAENIECIHDCLDKVKQFEMSSPEQLV